MDNLSGSAANWIENSEFEQKKEEVQSIQETINLAPIINKLDKIEQEIKEIYEKQKDKNINDALINLHCSMKALNS